jgi:hypothetical protein
LAAGTSLRPNGVARRSDAALQTWSLRRMFALEAAQDASPSVSVVAATLEAWLQTSAARQVSPLCVAASDMTGLKRSGAPVEPPFDI